MKLNEVIPKLKSSIYLVLISVILSCSSKKKEKVNEFKLLTKILKDSLKVDGNYKNVYYLHGNGCTGCFQSYLHFLEKNYDKKNLYIIDNSSSLMDVSFFKNKNTKNIYFDDYNYLFYNLNYKTSKFIKLNESRIDTLISINAENIELKFDFINKITTKKVAQ